MTLGMLFREGKETLRKAGVGEWELDAWYLLEEVTGITRSRYYLDQECPVEEAGEHRYRELLQKRSRHIPLQYLTGVQVFMGYPFLVDEQVLIPRQDTEILVEEAVRHLRPGMEILDLCTGSGCILLSILKIIPGISGTGADLSEGALRTAERNRKNLGVHGAFVRSDLLEQVEGSFDAVLSNPPYIPSKEIDGLMEEVREYEPRMALDGGTDGLYFYRKIIEQSPAYLKPDGMLFLEIGYNQAEAVQNLMEQGFTGIRVVKDLAGLDRVVYGRLKPQIDGGKKCLTD